MDRREFLTGAAAFSASAALPVPALALQEMIAVVRSAAWFDGDSWVVFEHDYRTVHCFAGAKLDVGDRVRLIG